MACPSRGASPGPRPPRLLATAAALSALTLACGGSPAQPPGGPPALKLSGIGDSMMQGANTSVSAPGEQPQYSFAQGTSPSVNSIFSRYQALGLLAGGKEFVSVSGAQMVGGTSNAAVQAGRICQQAVKPDRIVLLLGANDVCNRPTVADLYPVDTFRAALKNALDALGAPACGLPAGTRVHVLSVPRIDGLRAAGLAKDAAGAAWCLLVWSSFGICSIITQETDPAVLAQVANEQALRWIISHELSHLRRKDPLIGLLIGVAQSVFFFVPWFWKLRRDVRLNQEFLADAAAVDASAVSDQPSTNSAADYADFLVRLTCAGRLPVLAAGVKSPSSDLYRRVAMLLQKSGTVETNCPRRWSLLAGGGLLALGIVLGGLSFSSRNVAAEPDKKSVNDVEEEIRKALESLKKGLEAKKEKEEKPPVDLNPIDEARKAEEALKKAQEELRKNPTSDEARKAFQEAVKKYQETMRKRVPAVPNLPNFPEFPQFPPIQPLNPADFDKEIERINEQMQKAMEELQRQMQLQPGFFPPNGRMPFGGLRNINRRSGDSRLGIRVERPTPILVEQLDLPPNKGMVVTDVVPQSAGDKAGIKINDILLEIGAKQVTSELGDLQRMMREFKADEKVDVVLLRKGKKETIKGVTLPEAKPEQVNPFAPRFQFPNVPFNPPVPNVIPPGGLGGVNGTTMSVQVVNGDYTIKYQENGVKVTILGAKDDGQFKPSSIEIDDNGKTSKAESLEKVDAAHRPLVEKVLKQIR